MSKKIFISTGEASGDILGAGLIEAIKRHSMDISIYAMGGAALRRTGANIVCDIDTVGGIMGFTELGSRVGQVLKAHRKIKGIIKEWRPDLLILVDFGDFNLPLAKYAHGLGIPVLYFVPPKVWAWRTSRVKLLKRYVDKVCVIYPYEEKFLKDFNLKNITYVGNPWAGEIKDRQSIPDYKERRYKFLSANGLNPDAKIIALFPGSRQGEIQRHLSISLQGLRQLKLKHSDIEVVIAIAPGLSEDVVLNIQKEVGADKDWIKLLSASSQQILLYADSGLIKSGTSNLEAALTGLPFVMFFKVSSLTKQIVKLFVKIKEYSPVNIILPGTVKELVQEDLDPERIAKEVAAVTFDNKVQKEIRNKFDTLRRELERKDLNAIESDKSENILNMKGNKSEAVSSYDAEQNNSAYARCAEEALLLLKAKKNRSGIYRRVFSYVKPYRSIFLVAILCMVLFGASDGILPLLLKHVLDGIFTEHNQSLLYIIPFAIVLFTILRAAADFGQQYLMSKVGHGVVKDIRNEINSHILKLSGDFFLKNSSANLISRITSDVLLVKTLLTDAAAAVLRDSIRVIALLASAIYIDPTLALIAFVVFPLGIYPVYKFGKKMRKLSRTGQEAIGSLSSMLNESIVGQRVVKAFNREEYETEKFIKKNTELTKTFLKSERVKAITGPVNEVLASFAIAAILFYGGLSVIDETRTQGDFIAFLIALFLLYDPFKKLSRITSTIQQGMSGAERIFEILDSAPTIVEPQNPTHLSNKNDITIDGVSFAYGADSKIVLEDINLTVPEGHKVALVGLSGAGKSTLIDLIPRFIDPVKGVVKIGGVDVSQVSFTELRSRIAVVGQHTFLFNDTIFNNIAYGKEGATMNDVVLAAKTANAYDFINQLPDGFNTIVGEGGYSLSGGERQRISIARAILKDAPILILDEATASLDNKSEREVQRAIEELQKNRTCLIIAHRLSTIQNVDRVLVMKDGRIIESGTHPELLTQNGEYKKLYALQFGESSTLDEKLGENQEENINC